MYFFSKHEWNNDECIVDNLVHTMHDVLATLYDILQAAHD